MKAKLIGPTSRDPVTTYARQIRDGKILAGRLVRLACQRHLRDIDRQLTPEFPYWFDHKRAGQVFTFFLEFLTLDDGRPFTLMPWLQFIFGSLEGWVDAHGHRRFQTSYTETAKGTGKTPAASGYGLFCLAGKNERSAEIYSLGVDAGQANYLFKFAKRQADRSDDLNAVLEIGEHNIAWIDRASFFRPLSAEGRSLDNKRPYLAIVDELHEHPTAVIPEKMRLGFKGRADALLFEITNAGFDKTSVCWEHHDYSVKVLEGSVTGPAAERWFGYICQLDPCDACRLNGATQPNEGCQDCDDWTDERVWLKVNPSLNETITVAQMQALVDEAIDRPAAQARIKRLAFCMWTQSHTVWIPFDKWEACRKTPPPPVHGIPCAAMFDMSLKSDLTACVIAQRVDDAPGATPAEVEIADNEGGLAVSKMWSVNYRIRLTSYFWIPRETLIERVRNERVPLDVWERDGHLRATPGPVIDHHLIYDQFVNEIGPTFKPQRIGYDAYNATEFAVGLRDRAKYTVVEVPQGRKMSEYIKLFHALVLLGRIEHNGNPVLGWCIGNAEPKEDRYENMWLEKPSPTKRIDGAIAAIGATWQVIGLPRQRKRGTTRLWTPGGFVAAITPKGSEDTNAHT